MRCTFCTALFGLLMMTAESMWSKLSVLRTAVNLFFPKNLKRFPCINIEGFQRHGLAVPREVTDPTRRVRFTAESRSTHTPGGC